MTYPTILLLLLTLLPYSLSLIRKCPDQAEACEECPQSATECEFTFRVHERFSFVSYDLDDNKELSEKGYLHYLNSTGYHPARSGDGGCSFDGYYNDADFQAMGCSVPMTLDGENYRSLILINGRIPGPTIIVYEGQTVIIHVFNHLTDVGITIHWHGMYQRKSVWMDGVSHITQAPIDPGSSFDYIFKAEPAGTHWYHSHAGSQKSDGLFGAFIVRERRGLGQILGNPTYDSVLDLPGDHTLSLTDWQRKPEAIHQAIASIPFFTDLPIGMLPTTTMSSSHRSADGEDGASHGPFPFWSGLINGKGRRDSTLTPLSIFRVERGNMYHFRLIGAISIFAFNVSVDGHKLMAIASDGEYFEPREVDYIIIHSGETYDFILEANQVGTNFWIRAHTLENTTEDHSARGVLTYGDPNALRWTTGYSDIVEMQRPCSQVNQCAVLNCPYSVHPNAEIFKCISLTELVSRSSDSQLPRFPPQDLSNLHFLNFAFAGQRNTVNVNRFKEPPLSYATNCDEYDRNVNDSLICGICTNVSSLYKKINEVCECTNVVKVATNFKYDPSLELQSVGIVISAKGAGFAHPIHLHGHAFHVVYAGDATTDLKCENELNGVCTKLNWMDGSIPENITKRALGGRVINTAIKKDTVIVAHNQYVVIAFLADNPGYWFMHCHVEEHLLDGMAVLIQEYSSDQQWAPPSGINNHGSFKWSAAEYQETMKKENTCQARSRGSKISPREYFFVVMATVLIFWAIYS